MAKRSTMHPLILIAVGIFIIKVGFIDLMRSGRINHSSESHKKTVAQYEAIR